jgi:hypothetical protein
MVRTLLTPSIEQQAFDQASHNESLAWLLSLVSKTQRVMNSTIHGQHNDISYFSSLPCGAGHIGVLQYVRAGLMPIPNLNRSKFNLSLSFSS